VRVSISGRRFSSVVMLTDGEPSRHSTSNAPLASIFVKAPTVRSSVLILPLPRIPTQWQLERRTTTTAKIDKRFFFITEFGSSWMHGQGILDSIILGR